jgi:glyceraldehyde-3-phosphate dehydrogenase/erythrose-4-phosphate dehydrogenase
MTRVAINGFGRIGGGNFLRACLDEYERKVDR